MRWFWRRWSPSAAASFSKCARTAKLPDCVVCVRVWIMKVNCCFWQIFTSFICNGQNLRWLFFSVFKFFNLSLCCQKSLTPKSFSASRAPVAICAWNVNTVNSIKLTVSADYTMELNLSIWYCNEALTWKWWVCLKAKERGIVHTPSLVKVVLLLRKEPPEAVSGLNFRLRSACSRLWNREVGK